MTTPIVVCAIPMSGAFCVALSGSESVLLPWLTTILSFIPVLNPISTIYFVKSYRKAVVVACATFLSGPKFWLAGSTMSNSASNELGNNARVVPEAEHDAGIGTLSRRT